MRRLLNIIYILFCLELGIFLFILPWTSYWSKNYFINHSAVISGISRNYFFRGAVSGLGLADIWMALHEIWQLLHRPRTSDSHISK